MRQSHKSDTLLMGLPLMYSTVQGMGADTSRTESLKVIPKFPHSQIPKSPREGTCRIDTIFAIVHWFLTPSL